MEESIRLGHIRGIAIGLNWSLLVVFWLIAWSLSSARLPEEAPGYAGASYWVAGAITAAIFFGCIVAHELGHALVAVREGVQVQGITLWLFGGVAKLRGDAMTARAEFRIAIAGPIVSVVIGLAFLALGAAAGSGLAAATLLWLGRINLILVAFNMVPAFPLDGGRVLRAYLWGRRGDRLSATQSAARAGQGFGYALIAIGILEFFFAATIGGLWFVFLGWFLLNAARMESTATLLREALAGLHVEDVMTPDPVTAPADMTVEEFVEDFAFNHRFSAFPLMDRGGGVRGIVTINRMKRVPRDQRATTSLADIAATDDDLVVTSPNEPVVDLLPRMAASDDARAVVLVGDELRGIVSSRDVQRALELAGLRGLAALPVDPGR